MNTRKFIAGFAILMAVFGLISTIVSPAFADSNEQDNDMPPAQHANMMHGEKMGIMRRDNGIMGSVTAINGTTLTLTGQNFGKNTATTTYSVDASHATVVKNNATSTVSSIAIGDKIMVIGTINGTTITATMIRDGIMQRPMGAPQGMPFQGNGQPVIAGTISAVSGSTLTVTTMGTTSGSVTYTVDATNAKILGKGNATSSVSNITTGDHVIIQGAVNGTSVTASTVIDQLQKQNTNQNQNKQEDHPGFFGGIGNFFKHLFGF